MLRRARLAGGRFSLGDLPSSCSAAARCAHFLPSLSTWFSDGSAAPRQLQLCWPCMSGSGGFSSERSFCDCQPLSYSMATTCDHFTFHSFEPPSSLGRNLEHIVRSRPWTKREGSVLGRSWEWALQVWRMPAHTRSLLPGQRSLSRLHGLQGQGQPLKSTIIVHGPGAKGLGLNHSSFSKSHLPNVYKE